MMSPVYRLISSKLCPFVQRSVITLEEKGSDYTVEHIDLADKPKWFVDMSPFGKVPVLVVDSTVLFESAIINEYLDETAPGDRLHPSDPLERARDRAWIEFGSSVIVDAFMMQLGKTEAETRERARKVTAKLDHIEEQLGNGPYFSGSEFSLVDAAMAPMLQRLVWCERLCADLGCFEGRPKVAAFKDALLTRRSVVASLVDGANSIFVDFMKGSRGPLRNGPPTWLGTLAA